MRILMVTPAYHPFLEKGGPAVKVRAVAEGLAARGHQVTVLTVAHDERVQPSENLCGVEVLYLRPRLAFRALIIPVGLVEFCRERLREFDLVHVFGLYDWLGPAVARACREHSVSYVLEPLGMFRPRDRSLRLKPLWHFLLGRDFLNRAEFLVATSKQEHRELLDDGFADERVMLRYNGVSLGELAPPAKKGAFRERCGIAASEPLVLFLGRLIPRKGAAMLMDVFAKVCAKEGKLVVAGPEGEPGYLEQLRGRAQDLGIAGRVVFLGPLFGGDKVAAFADADVFVLPSRYENFGNTAAEAVACGTPVIVTDVCGVSELVDQKAGLVIPCEASALVEALRRLLFEKPLIERLRAGCGRVAAELDWSRQLDVQEEIYGRVLDKALPAARSFYDEHPFDWVDYTDAEALRATLAPLLRQILDETSPDDFVVDVGCGPGRVTAYVASQGRPCTGVDRSLQSIRRMVRACRRPGLVADNLCLPLKDGAADLVISDGVLHHTADGAQAFAENCRVLKDGGQMYLGVYRPGGRYEFLHRHPGRIVRWAVRHTASRWLVYVTLLPLYYAVHLLKSRGRRTWRGARNLFYDYFVSPRVDFVSRETVEQWSQACQVTIQAYDANPRSNVHSFRILKPPKQGAASDMNVSHYASSRSG